jgi:hypothetical protein
MTEPQRRPTAAPTGLEVGAGALAAHDEAVGRVLKRGLQEAPKVMRWSVKTIAGAPARALDIALIGASENKPRTMAGAAGSWAGGAIGGAVAGPPGAFVGSIVGGRGGEYLYDNRKGIQRGIEQVGDTIENGLRAGKGNVDQWMDERALDVARRYGPEMRRYTGYNPLDPLNLR